MAFSVAGDWPALANLPPRLDAPLFNKQRELSMNPLLNQATLQTVDNGRDAPFRSGMQTQSMPRLSNQNDRTIAALSLPQLHQGLNGNIMTMPAANRLHVGNLLYQVQPEEVLDLFKKEQISM